MLEAALSLPTHEFLSAVRDATADDGGAHAAEPAEAATAEAEVAAVVEGLVRGVAVDEAASDDARGAAGCHAVVVLRAAGDAEDRMLASGAAGGALSDGAETLAELLGGAPSRARSPC